MKIFNFIRRQSLSSNKFGKYLLYAIGEIILLVIGILLALQFNNLNDKNQTISVISNDTFRVVPKKKKVINRKSEYTLTVKKKYESETLCEIKYPSMENFSLLRDTHLLQNIAKLKVKLTT